MTVFGTPADRRLDPTREALRQTSTAWNDGFVAVLDHDLPAARKVMRGAASRRTILRAAHHAASSDVLADLARINRLLCQLAQSVLAVPDAAPLEERLRADVDIARRTGTTRLQYLADSMPRPAIDRDYITAGHELLDVLSRMAASAAPRGTPPDLCLTLVIALVQTSRHATRAA